MTSLSTAPASDNNLESHKIEEHMVNFGSFSDDDDSNASGSDNDPDAHKLGEVTTSFKPHFDGESSASGSDNDLDSQKLEDDITNSGPP